MNAWRDSAACADIPCEVFFPDTRTTGDPYAEARTICAGCPVVAECLEDALNHEEWGMRGGLTPDELHSLRRKRQMECTVAEKSIMRTRTAQTQDLPRSSP